MARTIKGINVKIGAETTGLKAALKDVDKQSRSISRELRKVNRGLRFNPDSTELLSQKQDILGEKIQTTSKRLRTLKDAQDDVEKQFRRGDIDKGQYRAFKREIVQTESKLEHFNNELKETNRRSSKLNRGFRKLKDVGSQLRGVMTTAGTAIAAVGTATGIAIKQTAEYAKEVRNGARAANASVQDYQNLSYVLKTVGIDADEASELLVEVNRVLGEAKAGDAPMVENLNALGMSVEDLQGMGTYELFVEITDGLRNMEDQSTKTAVAGKLFGEDLSRKLLPALSDTDESIESLVGNAEDLDLALSEEEIESWQDFNESAKEVVGQFQSLKREMATELLPFLKQNLIPYINDTAIPAVKNLTNALQWYFGTSFSWEGGDELYGQIMSTDNAEELESMLSDYKSLKEEAERIADDEIITNAEKGMNPWEAAGLRTDAAKQITKYEDIIEALNSRIKKLQSESTNSKGEVGGGSEDGGDSGEEKTPDEILENEIKAHKRRVELHKETRESYRSFLKDKLKMTDKYSQETLDTVRDELKNLNQEEDKLIDEINKMSWQKPSEEAIKNLMKLQNWDKSIAKQAREELSDLSVSKKEELEDINEELESMEGTVQEGSERWDNLQIHKTQITEKYQRKRKNIIEKYNKKQIELQDEIMKNKFKNNKISLREYRSYLKDRLEAYKKHTDEWENINDKIKNLESDEFEPIKFEAESPSDDELDKIYPELSGPPEDLGAKGVMDQYNKKLDDLKRKNEVWGESFDFASEKAKLLKKTINTLINLPGSKAGLNNNIINNLVEAYKEIDGGEGGPESLNSMTDAFVDMGLEIEEANRKFNNWKNDLIDGLTDAITRGEDLGDVFMNIADQIASLAIKQGIVTPIVNSALNQDSSANTASSLFDFFASMNSAHDGAYISPRGEIQSLASYHSGGITGQEPLKHNEQVVKTEAGELILTEEQQRGIINSQQGQNVVVIQATDAKSFTDRLRENNREIINAAGRNILENGALKNIIKDLR
mgnify:FL=1